MNSVEQLYDVTAKLNNLLQTLPSKEEREAYIEQINSLLDKRSNIFPLLPKEYTSEEKQIGLKIVKLNENIDESLNQIYNEIKLDIQQIKKTRIAQEKYNQGFAGDGMFFDKRK